jgi:L,D-transpeptidase-like protein
MSHPRRQVLFALPLIAILLTVTLAIPHRMGASPVADFAAPMSSQEAQAHVSVAQQADTQRRDAIAHNLGATSAASLPFVQNLFFSETNHHLSDRAGFLNYWRENGGVLLFGYPISEEIVENGRVVQYFERARFEYHPENLGKDGQILLSLLGRELTAERSFPDATPDMGTQYFPETKHTLSGKFLKFWLKRGGLAVFGYPISEPLDEVSPSDGQTRTTQYFERARFEYYPEALGSFYREREQANGILLAGLHEIELGDLGRQAAQRKGYAFGTSSQLAGAPDWSPSIWYRHIEVDLTAQYLTAYEGNTPVYQAPVATGKDGFNTPPGSYAIYSKHLMETMTGSAGGETWYVPDIPFVQYVVGGVALHGTYWHDQWGTGFRLSHGCINLNIDDAEWLYEWSDVGTQVDIHY